MKNYLILVNENLDLRQLKKLIFSKIIKLKKENKINEIFSIQFIDIFVEFFTYENLYQNCSIDPNLDLNFKFLDIKFPKVYLNCSENSDYYEEIIESNLN